MITFSPLHTHAHKDSGTGMCRDRHTTVCEVESHNNVILTSLPQVLETQSEQTPLALSPPPLHLVTQPVRSRVSTASTACLYPACSLADNVRQVVVNLPLFPNSDRTTLIVSALTSGRMAD